MTEDRIRRQGAETGVHREHQSLAVRIPIQGLLENRPFCLRHLGCGHRLREHGQHGLDRLAASDTEPAPLALNEAAHSRGATVLTEFTGTCQALLLSGFCRVTRGNRVRHVVHAVRLSARSDNPHGLRTYRDLGR